MKRFWNGLLCVLLGCELRAVTRTRVRLGNEYVALHICDRCDGRYYASEAAK